LICLNTVKKTRILPALFILIVFCGCNLPKSTSIYPTVFSAIEGSWKLEDSETIESWEFRDSIFHGQSFKLENSDTVTFEKLRILRKENKIFYEATVFQQNNGKPISFELTVYSKNEMNFENKFHDFPKKMHYEFPDEQSMIVTVSNEEKKVIFNFKKIK